MAFQDKSTGMPHKLSAAINLRKRSIFKLFLFSNQKPVRNHQLTEAQRSDYDLIYIKNFVYFIEIFEYTKQKCQTKFNIRVQLRLAPSSEIHNWVAKKKKKKLTK